jgi:hypothetical protein
MRDSKVVAYFLEKMSKGKGHTYSSKWSVHKSHKSHKYLIASWQCEAMAAAAAGMQNVDRNILFDRSSTMFSSSIRFTVSIAYIPADMKLVDDKKSLTTVAIIWSSVFLNFLAFYHLLSINSNALVRHIFTSMESIIDNSLNSNVESKTKNKKKNRNS